MYRVGIYFTEAVEDWTWWNTGPTSNWSVACWSWNRMHDAERSAAL